MSITRSIDARIVEVAGRQFGMITSRQLRDIEVSRWCVQRRINAGLMRKVVPCVYAVGPAAVDPGPDGWRMAGVLACGITGALSHESAAERHGLWNRARGPIHVTSAQAQTQPLDPRIVMHRSHTLDSSEIEVVHGVPTTRVARTILDLGRQLTTFQITYVLCEASFRGVLDLGGLERSLAARFGAPGTAVVRRAVELFRDGSAGTRSRSEDHLVEGLLRARLPEPMVNNRNAVDFGAIEPDLAWADAMLIVEVDGGGHDRPSGRKHDALRDRDLVSHGWYVHRVDARRVWAQRAKVVHEICSRYATRA